LDETLKAAAPKDAKDAWDQVRPVGRIDGELDLEQTIGKGLPKIDLTLRPRACSLKPVFFPYLLNDVGGAVRYRNDELTLQRLTARHGDAKLLIQEGTISFKPGGAIHAQL